MYFITCFIERVICVCSIIFRSWNYFTCFMDDFISISFRKYCSFFVMVFLNYDAILCNILRSIRNSNLAQLFNVGHIYHSCPKGSIDAIFEIFKFKSFNSFLLFVHAFCTTNSAAWHLLCLQISPLTLQNTSSGQTEAPYSAL